MEVKFYKPNLPPWDEVSGDIEKTYNNGILYPGIYSLKLEEMMRVYFKTRHIVTVSNASDSLILLLSDLPKGSKVIIPSYTFSATYEAIEWNGLEAVVTDVDDSGYIDPGVLEECLNKYPDAKCVIPVTMWGNVTYVEEIRNICDKYGVRLIYDAAHGICSLYDGKPIGNIGDAVSFSLAVTKPLACGEGSIVSTNNSHLGKMVYFGTIHGSPEGSLEYNQKGMNGKISEITSILAIHGVKYMHDCMKKRNELANYYIDNLKNLPIRFQKIDKRCTTARKDFGFWVDDYIVRNRLKMFLENSGIGIKTYFYPAVHNYLHFDGIVYKADNAEKLSATCINIPCYDRVSEQERKYIVDKVNEFFIKN